MVRTERGIFVELNPEQKEKLQREFSELSRKRDSIVGFDDQLEVGSWTADMKVTGRTCRWTRDGMDYESRGELYFLRNPQTGETRLAVIDNEDGVVVIKNSEFKSLIGGKPKGWESALRRMRRKKIVGKRES